MKGNVEVKKQNIIDELSREVAEIKILLKRLNDGVEFIDKNLSKGDILNSAKGVRLFSKIANETYDRLEKSLFINEFLTTGASVLISRDGKPVRTEDVLGQDLKSYTFVNPFSLSSAKELKEVFGEDYITFVDFK